MLVGIDSSENFEYIGVVVGEPPVVKEVLAELRRRLGVREIHTSRFSRGRREKLLKEFLALADSRGLTILCYALRAREKVRTLCVVRRMPRKLAWREVIVVFARVLKSDLRRRGIRPSRTEVDREFAPYINVLERILGCVVVGGPAAELADIVAYLNRRSRSERVRVRHI